MTNSYYLTRLTYVIAKQERRLRLGLIILSVLAVVGSGWALVDTPTETITEPTNVQTISAFAGTSAIVGNDSVLYEEGERISEPVYLLHASPILTISMGTNLSAGTFSNVTYEPRLEMSAVRDEQTFWRETQPLQVENLVVSDHSAGANSSLNMSALREYLVDLNDEIEGVGELRVTLVVETLYQTDRYSGVLETSAPMRIDDRSFSVVGPLLTEEKRSTEISRPVPVAKSSFNVPFPGSPISIPWLALHLFGLGLTAGLGALALPGFTAYIRPEELERKMSHAKYASWISTGQFSTDQSRPDVAISSLSDLIAIAIGTGERVVHDPASGTYTLHRNGIVYQHEAADTTDETAITGNERNADSASILSVIWCDAVGKLKEVILGTNDTDPGVQTGQNSNHSGTLEPAVSDSVVSPDNQDSN